MHNTSERSRGLRFGAIDPSTMPDALSLPWLCSASSRTGDDHGTLHRSNKFPTATGSIFAQCILKHSCNFLKGRLGNSPAD